MNRRHIAQRRSNATHADWLRGVAASMAHRTHQIRLEADGGASVEPGDVTTRAGPGQGGPDAWQPNTEFPVGTEINGRYRVEGILGAGGMGRVYRVTDRLYPDRPTALKTILGESQAHAIELFRSEFRAMASLEHPHVARVYDFEALGDSGDFLFTMELVDGRNLGLASRGLTPEQIALLLAQVVEALQYVHSRDLVHLDLKPSNVICGDTEATADGRGAVKVLDFGLVGLRNNLGQMFGTLMYMAPELLQGQVPDSRADLYSLGIMGYELLRGELPYQQHRDTFARLRAKLEEPVTLDSADTGIPSWLCEAVVRLCSVDPAARQAGADMLLEATRDAVHHSSRAEPSAEPRIFSSSFVGREAERSQVLAYVHQRLDATMASGPVALWVTGPSGIGKSRLMREARYELQLQGIPLLQGDAFEQAAAEYTIVVPVLLGAAAWAHTRGLTSLLERFGPEIVKIAPSFGSPLTIGASQPLDNPVAERQRILDAAADFLVELSLHMPYAVELSDLQWARPASIDLLQGLVERLNRGTDGAGTYRLALFGSFRSNEVEGRPLARLLAYGDQLQAHTAMLLRPLAGDETQQLVASMLGATDMPAALMSRIQDATGGLPFFVEETVRGLIESGNLVVDRGTCLVPHGMNALDLNIEVGPAILRHVGRLDEELRTTLNLLAVCGRPVEPAVLAGAAGVDLTQMRQRLRRLIDRLWVVAVAGDQPHYNLAHDRIRETLYAALDPASRDHVHGQVGHVCLAMLADTEAGERLFVTVEHLNAARPPESPEARQHMVEINLRAARAAHAGGSFLPALRYLEVASPFLRHDRWSTQHELAVAVSLLRAHCAYAVAALPAAAAWADEVVEHAGDIFEEVHGREIRMLCHTANGEHAACIETGTAALGRLDVKVPPQPSLPRVIVAILRFRGALARADLRRLLIQPRMVDARAIAVDRILSRMLVPAFLSRPRLVPVVVASQFELLLRHGNSPSCAQGYINAGVMCVMLGNHGLARQLGEIGLRLLPQTDFGYHGKALASYGIVLQQWSENNRLAWQRFMAASHAAREAGDLEFASYGRQHAIDAGLSEGEPLGTVHEWAKDALAVEGTESVREQHGIIGEQKGLIECLQTGQGRAELLAAPHDDGHTPNVRAMREYTRYWVARLYRRELGDMPLDGRILSSLRQALPNTRYDTQGRFHAAIVWLTASRQPERSWSQRLILRLRARRIGSALWRWERIFPDNFAVAARIVHAEWLRSTGRQARAVPLYGQAAALADQRGAPHDAALARELLSEVYLSLGQDEHAAVALDAAARDYTAWGAVAKVRELQQRRAALSEGRP
jgi:predicted ATPase/tRNA A-37 threonylcarbamoyl transferase component Bud32